MAVLDQSQPSPQSNVAAMVRVLLTWRGVDAKDLAKGISLSQQTLSDRLTGKRDFRSSEIERIASFFGVTPGVFYMNLDELLRTTITRLQRANTSAAQGQHLTVVASNDKQPRKRSTDRPLMTPVR